jgi:serine/threonine protein kinase
MILKVAQPWRRGYPPEFLLEAIGKGAEFTLYRARQHANPSPVLVVAATAEQPLPQSLRRLKHEYSLSAELEPAWAAKPLALTRHEGRTILVLADPGGEPLDLVLERDREHPLSLSRFLGLAINLATALGHAHQRGLIQKDVKPENALVDEAGRVWLTGFGIASRLPRERQAPAPPEMIAGTESNCSTPQGARILGLTGPGRIIVGSAVLIALGGPFTTWHFIVVISAQQGCAKDGKAELPKKDSPALGRSTCGGPSTVLCRAAKSEARMDDHVASVSAQTVLGGVLGGNLAFYTMITSITGL